MRQLGQRTINYEAPDGAGGAPEVEAGGEVAAPEGTGFDWSSIGEISDDLKPYIEGKDPIAALTSIIGERDTHKAGATRRREQIAEELGDDDDFIKGLAEKRGLVSVPKDEAGLIEFAKSRLGDATKYEHPEIEGADGEMLDAFSQAAREQGVGPKQYKAMIGGAVAAMQEKATEAATAMDETLKTDWGGDYAENNVLIENYLRAIGDEKAGDTMAVLSRFPPAQQRKAADVLVALGKGIGGAERNGDGSGLAASGAGSGDPEADWIEAKKVVNEAGGFEKATAAQQAEYHRAFDARKATQEAK